MSQIVWFATNQDHGFVVAALWHDLQTATNDASREDHPYVSAPQPIAAILGDRAKYFGTKVPSFSMPETEKAMVSGVCALVSAPSERANQSHLILSAAEFFVICKRTKDKKNRYILSIDGVQTHPKERGKGYAKFLTNELKALAEKYGIHDLHADTVLEDAKGAQLISRYDWTDVEMQSSGRSRRLRLESLMPIAGSIRSARLPSSSFALLYHF
jgi:GNAT superfamily N-acetyltransferase